MATVSIDRFQQVRDDAGEAFVALLQQDLVGAHHIIDASVHPALCAVIVVYRTQLAADDGQRPPVNIHNVCEHLIRALVTTL